MDHFFNATINHNFGRRRLRWGSPTWVDAFLAERGLTIMYTGKGERRDNNKKTRTMTQAGSKQQPVGSVGRWSLVGRSLVGRSVGRWSSVGRSLVGRSAGRSVGCLLVGRSVIGRRLYAIGCRRGDNFVLEEGG